MNYFAESIQLALTSISSDIKTSEDSETEFIFSIPIENKEGTLSRRMDVDVDTVNKFMSIKVCVKSHIDDKCNLNNLYKKINELMYEYRFVRMYVDASCNLIADYQVKPEIHNSDYIRVKQFYIKNLKAQLKTISSIIMQYATEIELFLKQEEANTCFNNPTVITEEQIMLNPFIARRKAV